MPGLPADGKAIVVSNSSLATQECPQKWWLSQVVGLRPERETTAQSFGNAFHLFSEHFHTWAMQNDGVPYDERFLLGCWCGEAPSCSGCHGTGWGPIAFARERWTELAEQGAMDAEAVGPLVDKLYRAARGYIIRYQGLPFQRAEVIAVEQSLAMPVLRSSGAVFRPAVDIVETDQGFALASSLVDVHGVQFARKLKIGRVRRVRWPWYFIGKLDVILRDRESGLAIIPDVKTSVDTGKFDLRFKLDPQLPGYARLVHWHRERLGVSGVLFTAYDVVSSSMQYDPHELKPEVPKVDDLKAMAEARGLSTKGLKKDDLVLALGIDPRPKLSTAANRTVPSWLFQEAVDRLGLGHEYDDHILDLETSTDRKLYRRLTDAISPTEMDRWMDELVGRCARVHDDYRIATMVAKGEVSLHSAFPRVPVCLSPGRSCPLEAACTHGPSAPGYTRVPVLAWKSEPEPSEADGDENELGW